MRLGENQAAFVLNVGKKFDVFYVKSMTPPTIHTSKKRLSIVIKTTGFHPTVNNERRLVFTAIAATANKIRTFEIVENIGLIASGTQPQTLAIASKTKK